MVISYILNLAWLVIMSAGVIPVIVYLMLRSICNTEIYSKDAASLTNYCFSLTQFGKYEMKILDISYQGQECWKGKVTRSRWREGHKSRWGGKVIHRFHVMERNHYFYC